MRYILPTDALDKLSLLRLQYQKIKNINIDDKPSMIGMPTMFGGTNVRSRRAQIIFLEKIKTVLQANLKKLDEVTSPEELIASVTAWRFYLSACWYVQAQNAKKGTLSGLIDNDLGINNENFFDDEDKENCFATAQRFIATKNALEDANIALVKAKLRPFTEIEWREFTEYLNEANIKKTSTNSYSDYPITSITQPLFRAAFAYSGATIGLLSGDVISQSTKGMSAKYQLTAFVGGTLLLFGPAGPTGVALFAPVIASKLITAFCSITLAHVLGVTLGVLGHGIGTAVGLPLDMAYHLFWKVCSLVAEYYYTEPTLPAITGIRIFDGKLFLSGIEINVMTEETLDELDKKQTIELKEDGSMYLDGKAIITPNSGIQLPSEVIDELKEHLKIRLAEANEELLHSEEELQFSLEQIPAAEQQAAHSLNLAI